MLFYYFASKDEVYRGVLERVISGMAQIHAQFRAEPGPVGLAEAIEGMTHFAAANLPAVKVLMREIMDGGSYLPELARRYLRPLFAAGAAEVERNMAAGIFRSTDPMHVLVNVGGVTLYYFLTLPLLELIWDRDPLTPAALAERAVAARDAALYGVAGIAPKGSAT